MGLLLVDPDARGTGIADLLLVTAERAAISRGHTLLRVHVDARNQRGQKFYARNGYQLIGIDKGSAILLKRIISREEAV